MCVDTIWYYLYVCKYVMLCYIMWCDVMHTQYTTVVRRLWFFKCELSFDSSPSHHSLQRSIARAGKVHWSSKFKRLSENAQDFVKARKNIAGSRDVLRVLRSVQWFCLDDMGGSWVIGVPPVDKPSSYWGTPMTMESLDWSWIAGCLMIWSKTRVFFCCWLSS